MSKGIIHPHSISVECCANLYKDARLDFTKQRPCPYESSYVMKGNLAYGRLFTGDGKGSAMVALCGSHRNLVYAGKAINVHFARHELNNNR